ncbi:MAG: hypothetical protein VXY98_05790 [Pseudomonadota bacterium]|nr:hypothetical protein [Pseudomonadota bacterium]
MIASHCSQPRLLYQVSQCAGHGIEDTAGLNIDLDELGGRYWQVDSTSLFCP